MKARYGMLCELIVWFMSCTFHCRVICDIFYCKPCCCEVHLYQLSTPYGFAMGIDSAMSCIIQGGIVKYYRKRDNMQCKAAVNAYSTTVCFCHVYINSVLLFWVPKYRKVSNVSRTKSQKWNDSRLVLQLSLPNPLKSGVKSRMKMYLEQSALLQLHLSD